MTIKITGLLSLVIFFFISFNFPAAGHQCKKQENCIIVDTARHLLWIREDGKNIKKLRVSIGRGGTNKTEQGDGKTPLGEYSLGTPRPSSLFVTFIPIGYPTSEQRAKGYSGGYVGVHGPSSIFNRGKNTRLDWTEGCIAVRSGSEISEIAQWVKTHQNSKILIK